MAQLEAGDLVLFVSMRMRPEAHLLSVVALQVEV